MEMEKKAKLQNRRLAVACKATFNIFSLLHGLIITVAFVSDADKYALICLLIIIY